MGTKDRFGMTQPGPSTLNEKPGNNRFRNLSIVLEINDDPVARTIMRLEPVPIICP